LVLSGRFVTHFALKVADSKGGGWFWPTVLVCLQFFGLSWMFFFPRKKWRHVNTISTERLQTRMAIYGT
jgi:hypothetical protein